MADHNTAALPEGTDKVIEGAANTGAIATERERGSDEGGTVTIEDTALVTDKEIPAPRVARGCREAGRRGRLRRFRCRWRAGLHRPSVRGFHVR